MAVMLPGGVAPGGVVPAGANPFVGLPTVAAAGGLANAAWVNPEGTALYARPGSGFLQPSGADIPQGSPEYQALVQNAIWGNLGGRLGPGGMIPGFSQDQLRGSVGESGVTQSSSVNRGGAESIGPSGMTASGTVAQGFDALAGEGLTPGFNASPFAAENIAAQDMGMFDSPTVAAAQNAATTLGGLGATFGGQNQGIMTAADLADPSALGPSQNFGSPAMGPMAGQFGLGTTPGPFSTGGFGTQSYGAAQSAFSLGAIASRAESQALSLGYDAATSFAIGQTAAATAAANAAAAAGLGVGDAGVGGGVVGADNSGIAGGLGIGLGVGEGGFSIGGPGDTGATGPGEGEQYGGQFTVGGRGGPDTQRVSFKATPGEQVRVVPPGANPFVNLPTPTSRQVQVKPGGVKPARPLPVARR